MSGPKPPGLIHPDSLRDQATAKGMLAAAKVAMDDQAWDLFNRWFEGKAPPVVVLESPEWATYMRADTRLAQQIQRRLDFHADSIRREVDAAQSGLQRRPLRITFHAEVGSAQGGYVTGYEVLHGSNASAGDFEMTGVYSVSRAGGPGSAYTVSYAELRYVFNDIVDANKRWSADNVLARTAANMAAVLGVGPPKDYRVKIQWSEPRPIVVKIAAHAAGKGPSWLQTFPNR